MAKQSLTKFFINDVRYWDARVFHPRYGAKKAAKEAATFAVRIQAHGQRRNVALSDTTKREAAKSPMALFKLVDMHGWERGLAEFRGEAPKPKNALTLGEHLAEVMATGEISPRTLRSYATKVRRIAADLGEIQLAGKLNKFDPVNGGAKAWQNLVDSVPLSKLTPAALHLGKAVHAALQAFHLARWRGGDDSPEAVANAYELAFLRLERDEGPVNFDDEAEREKCRQDGLRVVAAYFDSPEAMKEKPRAVEVLLKEEIARSAAGGVIQTTGTKKNNPAGSA